MDYLLIENKGEIDINGLILMGGSTKRDSKTSIGFFGSGNKYAIATLINKGISFRIFSGENEVVITTKEILFRDKTFKQIFINGKETSLTTDMGPLWEEWFAVREWVSNSIDEGESNIVPSTTSINARAGYTRIYVEARDGIKDVVDNWNNYFSFDREDIHYEDGGNRILGNTDEEESMVLFRRGIRSYHARGTKSLYHYDMKDFVINESRIIDDTFEANLLITRFYSSLKDENIIKNILKNAYNGEYYESRLSWYYGLSRTLSEAWRRAIGDHKIIVGDYGGHFVTEQQTYPCYIVCTDLARKIKSSFPDVTVYGLLDGGEVCIIDKVDLTPRHNFLLNECKKFFEESKYSVDYPIEVVNFVNKSDQLGLAKDGTIYISDKLFTKGKREIAVTIIEENEHLKTGYKDCSRAFQQHFINLFISEKEERFAYFL
jgi:hypothetical protein